MKTLLCFAVVILSGCASLQPSNTVPEAISSLQVEKEVPPLSRLEVINGIGECEKAGMRPVVISTKRKVNNQLVPSVVDVTCLPKL